MQLGNAAVCSLEDYSSNIWCRRGSGAGIGSKWDVFERGEERLEGVR